MTTIIHDPTRGWLLLTEKWSEKPVKKPNDDFIGESIDIDVYAQSVAHCLSTAIEIAKEDWHDLIRSIRSADHKVWIDIKQEGIPDHHPYSVDAEFEVKMKPKGAKHLPWLPRDSSRPLSFDGSMEYIARLVKAKEVDPDYTNYTPPMQDPNKFIPFSEPTESQDELIREFAEMFIANHPTDGRVEEAKKRFRIERI